MMNRQRIKQRWNAKSLSRKDAKHSQQMPCVSTSWRPGVERSELQECFGQSDKLQARIKTNLEGLDYGE